LQNFLNDLVANSPHLGRAKNAPNPTDNHGRSKLAKKRPLDTQDVDATIAFEVRDLGEAIVVEAAAVKGASSFKTPTELTYVPSLELLSLKSFNDIRRVEGLRYKCDKEGHRVYNCLLSESYLRDAL
jgi:hypothetical protein